MRCSPHILVSSGKHLHLNLRNPIEAYFRRPSGQLGSRVGTGHTVRYGCFRPTVSFFRGRATRFFDAVKTTGTKEVSSFGTRALKTRAPCNVRVSRGVGSAESNESLDRALLSTFHPFGARNLRVRVQKNIIPVTRKGALACSGRRSAQGGPL